MVANASGSPLARPSEDGSLFSFLIKWAPVIVATGALALSLHVLLPGGMSGDSVVQLRQAISGRYDDWHPPVMSWLWRQLNRLHFGPASIVTLHCVLYWGAILVISLWVARGSAARCLLIVTMGFFPTTFVQIGVVWKDTSMSCFGLASLALLLCVRWLRRGFPRSLCLACSLAGLIYFTAVRHNALFALLPLVYLWIRASRPGLELRGRFASTVRAFAIVVLMARFANSTLAPMNAQLFQITAFHDLLGISLRVNSVLLPPAWSKGRSLEELEKLYDPGNGGWIFFQNQYPRAPQHISAGPLRDAWLRAIWNHPTQYLEHRYNAYLALVNVTYRGDQPWWYRDREPQFGFHARDGWARRRFLRMLRWLDKTVLRKGWFYLLGSCVCIVCALAKSFPRRHRELVLVLCASGLMYALAYFFLVPSPEFRYLYWTITTSVVSGAIVACWVGARVGAKLKDLARNRSERQFRHEGASTSVD